MMVSFSLIFGKPLPKYFIVIIHKSSLFPSSRERETSASMKMEIVVREFDDEKDYQGAQRLEAMCDVDESGSGKISLTTDLLGNLISRVRHSPPYRMLVRIDIGIFFDRSYSFITLLRIYILTKYRTKGSGSNTRR